MIAANGPVTAGLARQIAEVFTEVVIAPGFDAEALDIPCPRARTIRLLKCAPPAGDPAVEWRPVSGGILLQSVDRRQRAGR